MKRIALIAAMFLTSAIQATACELTEALSKWKSGDIEEARACAERVADSAENDRRNFLLMGIAFTKGQYAESIRIYRTLSRSFSNFKGATVMAAQAAHHLHDFVLSRQLIEEGGVDDPGTIAMFRLFEQQPLSIS